MSELAKSSISPINFDDGTPGFGLYLHWPFCAAKCPYCDFNSHVRHNPPDQEAFAKAFGDEMRHMYELSGSRKLTSIFLGGGTPSLMKPETVANLLDTANDLWGWDGEIEITLEANPTSVDAGRFAGYRSAGVNRISLGVQSLNDEALTWLGRLHSAEEAKNAIALSRELFPRMSFDLIYARHGQSLDAWQSELNSAIDLAADHLSLYQLTIEPETAFWGLAEKGKSLTLPPDEAATMYELTQELTASRGLPAYEISNHAKEGCESRHNLTYWRYGDYIGVGPGAHGRLSDANGIRIATATQRMPEEWLSQVQEFGHGMVEETTLKAEEIADEMLLMGLRLREGLDLERYEAQRGYSLSHEHESFLNSHGLIERLGNSRIRATQSGAMVLDAVVADLVTYS